MSTSIEDDRGEAGRGPGSPPPRSPSRARELLPLVYDELRRLAAQRMARESPGQTLQATALVHEAYLRLVGADPDKPWDGRGHFFAAAAESMRRILVDSARRRHRLKRGGHRGRVRPRRRPARRPRDRRRPPGPRRCARKTRRQGPGQGPARPAPRLRRGDPRRGRRDPRPVHLHGRPLLGLCPRLAPRRDRRARCARDRAEFLVIPKNFEGP